jgi:hypothetical protein
LLIHFPDYHTKKIFIMSSFTTTSNQVRGEFYALLSERKSTHAISREFWSVLNKSIPMKKIDKSDEHDEELAFNKSPKRMRTSEIGAYTPPPSPLSSIEHLVANWRFTEAVQLGGKDAETACLRKTVASLDADWQIFQHSTAPTLHNVHRLIETGRDAEVVELIKRGFRFDDSARARGVLLDLFERDDMKRTIAFLQSNKLLPDDLDLKFLYASLESGNAELAHDLTHFPRIEKEISALPRGERDHYYELYCYSMFRYMARNALDYVTFEKMAASVHLADLTDDEFLTLIRHGSLFLWASDAKVLELRRINGNPYRMVTYLSPLAHWLELSNSPEHYTREFREQLDAHLDSLPRTDYGVQSLISVFRLPSFNFVSLTYACAA